MNRGTRGPNAVKQFKSDPRNHFVFHKAGNQDAGLFRAAAGGVSIGPHTVPRKPFSASTLSRGSGIEHCQ
jgi:hypothetical protein